MAYFCADCGNSFTDAHVEFWCSMTHRAGYRGSGTYLDCPECKRWTPALDKPLDPAAPKASGPKLPPIMFDTETIKPAPVVVPFFFQPPSKKRGK